MFQVNVKNLALDERFSQKKPVEDIRKKVAQRDLFELNMQERSLFQVNCFDLLQYHFEKTNKATLSSQGGAIEESIGLVRAT